MFFVAVQGERGEDLLQGLCDLHDAVVPRKRGSPHYLQIDAEGHGHQFPMI
jgi:hypothetical protein